MTELTKPLPTSSVVGEILGEITTKRRRPEPCAVVIFGALGDLSGRKLAPAFYNLLLDGALAEPTAIIGLSRGDQNAAQFADHLKPRVTEFSRQKVEASKWDKFAAMLEGSHGVDLCPAFNYAQPQFANWKDAN